MQKMHAKILCFTHCHSEPIFRRGFINAGQQYTAKFRPTKSAGIIPLQLTTEIHKTTKSI